MAMERTGSWQYVLRSVAFFFIAFLGGIGFNRLTAEPIVVDSEEAREHVSVVQRLLGSDSNESEVDFGMFWAVWHLVEESYARQPIDQQAMMEGAISGMLDALDDPHTSYLDVESSDLFTEDLEGEFGGIGAEIGFDDAEILSIVAPLPDTPAARADLRPEDQILAVNGEVTEGLSLLEAVGHIRGPKGTEVVLLMRRAGGDPFEVTIVRDIIDVQSATLEKNLTAQTQLQQLQGTPQPLEGEVSVHWLTISTFDAQTADEVRAKLTDIQESDGTLVVDMRNNPGGLLESAIEVADLFIPKGEVIVSESVPGKEDTVYEARRNPIVGDRDVIVLVNRGSASAAEILAGALRDQLGATVVGETTFGKGSVQELRQLKNGAAVRLTVAFWKMPNGQVLDEEGIEPSVVVEFDEENPDLTYEDVDTAFRIKTFETIIERQQSSGL